MLKFVRQSLPAGAR